MTVNTELVRNAVKWFAADRGVEPTWWGTKKWFIDRNQWLKSQGIGGMVINDNQEEEIPDWFFINDEFWFVNEAKETLFVLRWS